MSGSSRCVGRDVPVVEGVRREGKNIKLGSVEWGKWVELNGKVRGMDKKGQWMLGKRKKEIINSRVGRRLKRN